MYWDDETSASVEAPLGDFFGLGLGNYFQFESIPLVVAPDKALNCFFPMPFRKRSRITITNEGKEDVDSFYFNIDYQALNKDLPPTPCISMPSTVKQRPPKAGLISGNRTIPQP
jgi:hypothetical protein